jgi:hypothetical protein
VPKASKYTFLPWAKTGLGTFITNNEQDLQGPQAKIHVQLSVRRFDKSNNPWPGDEPISKDFLLYGPSDIIGILNSVITRISPKANDQDVEPNYFPFIEFSQPDFPWRYTPAVASGAQPSGRLSPWISLIVLKEQEFVRSTTKPGLLPQIVINDPVSSLPDLEQSWGWAHTQITQQIQDTETLRETLASEPHKMTSRILALRKLEPNSHYVAFLVPTFEVGRLAGLGLQVDGRIKGTSFAWRVSGSPSEISPTQHILPVYYQWQFSTSIQGEDFESLVRKLEPLTLSERIAEMIGILKLDVSKPFTSVGREFGLQKPLFFGGVLWSPLAKRLASSKKIDVHNYVIPSSDPEDPSPQEIKNFIMKMKELIDLGESLSWSFVKSPISSEDPIISPPMYGKWHAMKKLISKIGADNQDPDWIKDLVNNPMLTVEERIQLVRELNKIKNDSPYPWLEELNLDPDNRAAAGLGTTVAQKLQEELMASAWDQAGSLREVNKHLRLSQLARTISSNLFDRCFKPMQPSVFINLVSPFHPKVILKEVNRSVSVARLIRESPIPNAIFSPSFTKITAKRGKIHRKLFQNDVNISSILIEQFNKPSPVILAPKLTDLLTIDHLVELHVPNKSISEEDFQGDKLNHYLSNQLIPNSTRKMVESIEISIPSPKSTVEILHREIAPLDRIYERLKESLDPGRTIHSKVSMEVRRPERLQEEKKDVLDPIVAYPKFKRPMFEPLRDLSEDLLLPGVKNIPINTITIVEPNPRFINSYMAGLNHEMARELLWREYTTDQRGSYFRQFWDTSVAVQRERLKYFNEHGDYPPVEIDEQIIERFRDIPEIHKWKDSTIEGIQGIAQAQRTVLLIRSELLRRYPGAVIYASKAKYVKNTDGTFVINPDGTRARDLLEPEEIEYPVFRGDIKPDIVFLGFEIPEEELKGDENQNAGWYFVIQEQPSELRFGIDLGKRQPSEPPLDPASLTSWDDLNWDYDIILLPGSNNNIDLDNGSLKGKQIANVTWGSHAADLANILLQRPVRIVVHGRELLKELVKREES